MESDEDKSWYYTSGEERKGPVTRSAMLALAEAGVVGSDTLVWTEGMSEWEPAWRHVKGVVPPAPGAKPAVPGVPKPAAAAAGDYHRQVGFGQAVSLFFSRYVDFAGRSNRGEFWWWFLAAMVIGIILQSIDVSMMMSGDLEFAAFSSIWSLATVVPSLALTVRRLHDIDKSGWFVLLWLIPIVGWIILIIWFCQRGSEGPNRFA